MLPRAMREAEDLDAWADRLASVFGHDLADSPPVTMKQIAAYRAFDSTPRCRELADIPTLVVAATEDPLSPPRLGRALADAIPGARYHEFAGASHGLTVTHADEINRVLAEHFAGGETASR